MSARGVFRPLGCLFFGHAPTVEVNEGENKAEYVCERCRAALGDFVTNLRQPWTRPVGGAAYGGPEVKVGGARVIRADTGCTNGATPVTAAALHPPAG